MQMSRYASLWTQCEREWIRLLFVYTEARQTGHKNNMNSRMDFIFPFLFTSTMFMWRHHLTVAYNRAHSMAARFACSSHTFTYSTGRTHTRHKHTHKRMTIVWRRIHTNEKPNLGALGSFYLSVIFYFLSFHENHLHFLFADSIEINSISISGSFGFIHFDLKN